MDCSSDISSGQYNSNINMYKLAILFVVLAGAFAAPDADPAADAHYVPALYNSYPDWPGVSTPYFSSTCFGCRGKREAEADAHYGYGGYARLGYGLHPYAVGVAGHPGFASSFVARSPQGLRGKREAESDAHYGYGGYARYGYGHRAYGYGYGYPYGYARW